jgi:metal-responsive CopG/Arc/MetJ family transcriptional regulator
MRTHVILPDNLVAEIDGTVGKRKRSHFVEEAIREKLKQQKLLNALKETAGILTSEEYPEWATTEKAAKWVSESRKRDDERMKRVKGE